MPENIAEKINSESNKQQLGTVMVIGAGVSGIQAALDSAASGFKVYLVEKGPAIGGKMSQLDKTFPTNDCSMCILSPKFIECANNPNITILTNTSIDRVDGDAGNFEVQLTEAPRYVDEDKCTGCGTCAEYCPVLIPDTYNEDLGDKKCISVHFPQAVPAISMVDANSCLFLNRGECQICVPTCANRAIDFHQQPKTRTLEVGSLILAPGYEAYDPEKQSMYGYNRFSNIVTSLEYERLLSASGPNEGELKRPSDGKTPHKIAWIQCVGSRDEQAGCTYCSAVCCMYATKQVILSKEHHPETEVAILHNDVRAYGKGFERYYDRAKAMDGVRYIWSKASVLEEKEDTKNVVVRYRINGEEVKDEEFDLVVLSVGLNTTDDNRNLAETLSIDVNEHGFCENPEFSPIKTSRPGIFSCGVFNEPMDIPDSVTMASGAASLASQLLWEERGTMVTEKVYPEERDTRNEEPRVGVFVCDCGTNVAKVVNVPSVVEYAKGLKDVVYAVEEKFACSVDSVSNIANTIKENRLNRVVVAACTPRTHEPVFREALKEAGLNQFLFEFANIREHCSFVHMGEKPEATDKAKDLVRMGVFRSLLLEPLYQISYGVTQSALVIGGGIAGMVSGLSLAKQGIKVDLIEKQDKLGGVSLKIPETLEGEDVQVFVKDLIEQVANNELLEVHIGSELIDFTGYVGNFQTKIKGPDDKITEISHGATIVATGANESKPKEYFYGEDERVKTLLELDEVIEKDPAGFKDCNSMVFIQCVGSRDEERPYCSRVCCSHSVKNALKLKELNPEMDIYVLYRDMRTYGFKEDYYKKASDQGIVFIRYTLEDKPEVRIQEGGEAAFSVSVIEPMLGGRLMLGADMVCLAAATIPPVENKAISQMLKIAENEDSFFLEAHMKLRPVDFATEGIFMCGSAHSPKFISESIAQAQAAASKALTILAKEEMVAVDSGATCEVDETICESCGACVSVCNYDAVVFADTPQGKKARVNPILCKGDGLCNTVCPAGAIVLKHFTDEEIFCQIDVAAPAFEADQAV